MRALERRTGRARGAPRGRCSPRRDHRLDFGRRPAVDVVVRLMLARHSGAASQGEHQCQGADHRRRRSARSHFASACLTTSPRLRRPRVSSSCASSDCGARTVSGRIGSRLGGRPIRFSPRAAASAPGVAGSRSGANASGCSAACALSFRSALRERPAAARQMAEIGQALQATVRPIRQEQLKRRSGSAARAHDAPHEACRSCHPDSWWHRADLRADCCRRGWLRLGGARAYSRRYGAALVGQTASHEKIAIVGPSGITGTPGNNPRRQ